MDHLRDVLSISCRLRKLDLSGSVAQEADLAALAPSLAVLEDLTCCRMDHLSDGSGLAAIAASARHTLRRLHVAEAAGATLSALGRLPPTLVLEALRELTLSELPAQDEPLRMLFRSAPALAVVRITACPLVGTGSIAALLGLSSLESLSLNDCQSVRGPLELNADWTPSLRELCLSFLPATLFSVSGLLSGLERLEMLAGLHFDDGALLALAPSCFTLRHLHASQKCRPWTIGAVTAVLTAAQATLQELIMDGPVPPKLASLLASAPRLAKVRWGGGHWPRLASPAFTSLRDLEVEGVPAFPCDSPCLERLCWSMADADPTLQRALSAAASSLRHVELRSCAGLTLAMLSPLFAPPASLSHLVLHRAPSALPDLPLRFDGTLRKLSFSTITVPAGLHLVCSSLLELDVVALVAPRLQLDCPLLSSLRIQACNNLSSLEFSACTSLACVTLVAQPLPPSLLASAMTHGPASLREVRVLSGLPPRLLSVSSPGVRTLRLRDLQALEVLTLGPLPVLSTLDLSGCFALRQLDWLSPPCALTDLNVRDCSQLSVPALVGQLDVAGPVLRSLDLWDCQLCNGRTALLPLVRHPSLCSVTRLNLGRLHLLSLDLLLEVVRLPALRTLGLASLVGDNGRYDSAQEQELRDEWRRTHREMGGDLTILTT